MNTVVQWFQSLSGDGSLQGFLLAGAIKGTVLLALALAIVKLLHKASAATRHLTVTLGLAALLVIPFFAFLLPAWRLAVLPAPRPDAVVSADVMRAAQARSEMEKEAPAVNTDSEVGEKPASVLGTTLQIARLTGAVETRKIDLLEGMIDGARVHWKRILVLTWLSVAFLLLSRLAIGMARIAWIVRRADRVEDESALELLDSARHHLQLDAWPRLLCSDRVQVPLVWGFFRPVLILPRDSRAWSTERLRVVLLHELAHVKRFDGLTLLLTSAVASLYWFHPLVWLADRFGRRECERACDDLVLQSGTRPSEYADHLLSIARALPEAEALGMVTLAMSRGSQLEGRLLAILHPAIRRRTLSSRVVLTAAVVTILLAAPLATIELRAKPAPLSTGMLNAGDLAAVSHFSGSSTKVVEFDPFQAEYDFPGDPTDLQLEVRASDESSSDPDIDKGAKGDKWSWKTGSSDSWFDRGMELHNKERFEEARAAFQKSIDEGHREATAMYNIACGYSMMNDRENALLWLQKAFDNGFNMTDHLLEDSDLDPLRADARFKKLVEKLSIEHHDRRKYDSQSSRKRDRLEGTLQKYETLLSEKSTDGQYWYKVGSDLLRIRELDKGIDSLKRAVDLLDYQGESAMYNLACAYAIRGDRELALQWLEKSIYAGFGSDEKLRHDPDLASLRSLPRFNQLVETTRLLELNLGNDKWDDSLDEAIARHERFVRSNPTIGRGWFNLGFALHTNGDYRKAIDAYDRAIKLDHRVPTSMYNIACGYSRLNQKDEAIAWLQKAKDAGFELKNYIHHDDDLKNLRSDPRFRKLRDENRGAKGDSWEWHWEN